MFCPECGNQIPDSAKFCNSCGYQTTQASGAAGRSQQVIDSASGKSRSNYLWFVIGGMGLLIIAGLVSFMLFRGSATSSENSPTARVKITPNTTMASPSEVAQASNTSNVASPIENSPPSNIDVATPSPKPSASTPKPVDLKTTCKTHTNTVLTVSATGKTILLNAGNPLNWTDGSVHQGIIVVKAKVGDKWIQGEVSIDDTTCN